MAGSMMTIDRLRQMKGQPVFSADNEKIGGIEEIFLDDQTNQPEWIGLGSGGIFGSKRVVVPVETANVQNDGLHVPYSKDQVKGTPAIKGDEIDQKTEQQLYTHYGLNYSQHRSETGLAAGRSAGGPSGTGRSQQRQRDDATITRSEEEMRVGKRDVDAGTVRLRKFVETEPVTEQVQLRQERVDIEREPVNKPARGGQLGDQEVDVNLRREEPVVEKNVVEKEQIRARKRDEMTTEDVGGEVRKERVDIEGDEGSDAGRRRG
jgi:uncharacterized protein (TIGR02271 family)